MEVKMVKIFIDGKEYMADASKNLLEVMLTFGFNLPYFCWHPAMGSVGACRQCAVIRYRDENDTRGKIVMSCMEPVTENLHISFSSPAAMNFRKGIIEWLMVNHPHDCPVCDEGGECHLQDMTVMTGHNYRRFYFQKRTHLNQNLGPFVNHEMNRCIQCYRCVRFYRNYAGGRDLDVFSAHDNVYFGRHKDGVLENEFSGNLVEVCPTGVFTDKTLKKHYTRKWDLTNAPSICTNCSVGCNILSGERYGTLRRILTRYNGEVNGYFLCDRGRFGYEYVNSNKRITSAFVFDKKTGEKTLLSKDEVIGKIKNQGINKIVGIGSPRASLESNFALKNFVSENNFYAGENKAVFRLIKKIYNTLKNNPVRTPSLREIEKCDAVLILGEDITNTAPMMALAVRQAAKQKPLKSAMSAKIPAWNDDAVRTYVQETHGPVFIATPYPSKLNEIASEFIIRHPDEIAEFGFALANSIDKASPVNNIKKEDSDLINNIVLQLKGAEKPLIISGTGCLNESIIDAAFNIANALYTLNKNTVLSFALPENNSMGLAMIADKDLDDLFNSEKETDTLIILENDLYRRKNEQEINKLLLKFKNIIVLDHLVNQTVNKADVIIPIGTFAESDGTFVNNEGRAQRFYQVYMPKDEIKESWRWLEIIDSEIKGKAKNLYAFNDFVEALISTHSQFKGIEDLAPPNPFTKTGQKVPRQTPRFSGRTAITANINVSEEQPPNDIDSPLAFSMEGYSGKPPSSVVPFFWSPGWNSAHAINKFQIEIGGPLHGGDPGIRLIEPSIVKFNYFSLKSSQLINKNLFAIPVYHIFGSEELSSESPGIEQLAPLPYIGLSAETAIRLKVADKQEILVENFESKYKLIVKIIEGFPADMAGIPYGLKDFYFDFDKQRITINKL